MLSRTKGFTLADRIRELLPKSKFTRSVSVLVGGSAGSQALVVLASPLITRLYTPNDFGLLGIFSALLGIVTVIVSLRYQLAIPLPAKDEDAANIVALSLLIVLLSTSLLIVLILFFGEAVAHTLNSPALEGYLWLLPVGVFLVGVYQTFNYWGIRMRAFPVIARTKLTQTALMVGVQIIGAGLGPVMLLSSHVLGQAAGVTTLFTKAIWPRRAAFFGLHWREIAKVGSRYRRFPLYSTLGGGLNTAGSMLPPLLFAMVFDPIFVGFYVLAHRVLAMPSTLIGRAVADVFFITATEDRRSGSLNGRVALVSATLSQLGLAPLILLALSGSDLFAWVFGEKWRTAGVYAQWLMPMVYAGFITSPISTLTSILEKQKHAVVFQGALFGARIVAIGIGASYDSIILAVALFSLGSAATQLCFLAWAYRASGNTINKMIRTQGGAMIWAVILTLPVAFVYLTGLNLVTVKLIALILSAGLILHRSLLLHHRANLGYREA